MKKNNIIPRKFNRITCKMLIETNANKPGDVLHVYRNDFGLCALNTATGKYFYNVVPQSLARGSADADYVGLEITTPDGNLYKVKKLSTKQMNIN